MTCRKVKLSEFGKKEVRQGFKFRQSLGMNPGGYELKARRSYNYAMQPRPRLLIPKEHVLEQFFNTGRSTREFVFIKWMCSDVRDSNNWGCDISDLSYSRNPKIFLNYVTESQAYPIYCE